MKILKGFSISSSFFIGFFILIIIFVLITELQSNKKINPPVVQEKKDSYSGILWTSGLNSEESEKLNIKSKYQLIKANENSKWPESVEGLFLLDNENNYFSNKHVSKCIKVEGDILDSWKELNNNDFILNGIWTYKRLAINVNSIEILDQENCTKQDLNKENTINDSLEDLKTFTGTLQFMDRPAPDIDYDYKLDLNEVYIDNQSSSGLPTEIYSVIIVPQSLVIEQKLNENINSFITIKGFFKWGYAESKYFEVNEVSLD